MTLMLISPPAQEPLTLSDIKEHLRLTTNDDDSAVSQLLVAARHALEARAGLAFLPQQWRLSVDGSGGHAGCRAYGYSDIILPITPIRTIDQIECVHQDGTKMVIEPDQYITQTGSVGRIQIKGSLPISIKPFGGLEITFTAGHDAIDRIPAELRHAIRLLTAHFFENRESAGERRVFSIPRTIDALIAPYRRVSL